MAQKLSKTQQEVVDLMKQGWKLCVGMGFSTSCWIQPDGIGKGGKIKRVHSNTAFALISKDVVRLKSRDSSIATYVLADDVLS